MNINVVVTGLSCITSIGNNLENTWTNIISGKPGTNKVRGITFDNEYQSSLASNIKNSSKDLRTRDRFGNLSHSEPSISLMHECMEQVLCNCNIERDQIRDSGIIIGTTSAGMISYEKFHKKFNENDRKIAGIRHLYDGLVGSNLSCVMDELSVQYGLTGFSTTVESACASGSLACCIAHDMIKLGNENMIIVGGVDLLCDVTYSGFASLRILENEIYRPFDKDRQGLVLGEAASIMILENEEHAKKRGAKIYARLSGCGLSCDAADMTAPDIDGNEAANAMLKAIEQSGLALENIDYINAHGTGTQFNDISEANAIKKAFGEKWKDVYVSSTKSMTGHTLGAAGVLEAIISIMSIYHGIIPPTANLKQPTDECQLRHVPEKALKKDIKAVISNSFGFGGINASLLFTKFEGGK